jgi:uncharacterized membrane protein
MLLLGIEDIYHGYEGILEFIAGFSVVTLELIGIIIIVVGAFKSIVLDASKMIKPRNKHNIRIALGQALALGLEFKMGAEIIKTVLVRDLQELIILAFIIALRAGLAVLIHWEIKLEKKECEERKEIGKSE